MIKMLKSLGDDALIGVAVLFHPHVKGEMDAVAALV